MNSPLLVKSDINLMAAESSNKNNYYCSAIHSAYYSCVQLMLYIIYYKIQINPDNIKSAIDQSRTSSHEFYINQVVKYLKENKEDWKMFNSQIQTLKKLRKKSDYLDTQIDPDDGLSSYRLAESSNKILKKVI